MYKGLTVYLYQNNFYEDLVLELFEIEQKKKEIFRKMNSAQDIKYLEKSDRENLLDLLNREMMILHDLVKANSTTADELGFVPDLISGEDED